jgi:hypothetical protein
MPDSLRERIAAAITEVDRLRVCKLTDADTRFIVDAVIRAVEDDYILVPKSHTLARAAKEWAGDR